MRYTISLLLASATLSAAEAGVPRVVTDLPPVQSLTAQVMGDLGVPLLLLDRGADAHSFQLRPSQAAALQAADLVVWVGPEMTPWLDRALAGVPQGAVLGLLSDPGTLTRVVGAAGTRDPDGHANADAGHDDAAGNGAGTDDHDHDHDHTGRDPHAWLDPANARHWLRLIAAELTRLDPENAPAYAANAAAADRSITVLDAEIAATLVPLRAVPIVVFHDAYGYLADHYGLTIVGSVAPGDAAAPGAAHLSDLGSAMAEGTVICIFPEANHDPKLLDTMREGTDARIGAPLDPEGAALDPGPELYAALLRGLARTLADCVAGA